MLQCCKITGFPQCFLLFVRLCHGNLEPVHVGDSGLSCKAQHSGIHDVSGSCAKAFLRLLSDSSTQELHCRDEEITVGHCRRESGGRKERNSSEVWLQDTLHEIYLTQFTGLVRLQFTLSSHSVLKCLCVHSEFKWPRLADVLNMEYREFHCSHWGKKLLSISISSWKSAASSDTWLEKKKRLYKTTT